MTNQTDEMPELLPCPFCGGEGSLVPHDRDTWCEVECLKCHAKAGATSSLWDTNTAWNTRSPAKPASAERREALVWKIVDPAYKYNNFVFEDSPGEHDPCFVICPGGKVLEFNDHAGEGVDIARAKFIVDACNAALTADDAQKGAVQRAMDDATKRSIYGWSCGGVITAEDHGMRGQSN